MPLATLNAAPGLADPTRTKRLPRILVFDSGLGGLTVFGEIAGIRSAADYLYVADNAVFPYGALSESALIARVLDLMRSLIALHRPDVIVIACNTASTLVLPPLRVQWPDIRFVGTVPAIKPAAAASKSRMFSVLATPGTVARDYTRDLVNTFADHCRVTLVGAARLATLAEAALRGEVVPDRDVMAEIAPAFVEHAGNRTDTVVLACTHFPLLGPTLERLAPWPVTWMDPAPAIARRVETLLADTAMWLDANAPADETHLPSRAAIFTSAAEPTPTLRQVLRARGLIDLRAF